MAPLFRLAAQQAWPYRRPYFDMDGIGGATTPQSGRDLPRWMSYLTPRHVRPTSVSGTIIRNYINRGRQAMGMVRLFRLAILAIASVLPHESTATIGDKRTVTWNLQGSSANKEAKWNVNVRAVLLSGVDIMAIQEAGMPPASATLISNNVRPLHNPSSLPVPVNYLEWNLGTRSRPDIRYIFFAHNDSGANRVNVAIVTRHLPNEVILWRPHGLYVSARPLLGVRFGSDFYFSIHASARQGWDAPHIVRNIMENSSDRCTALHMHGCEVMIMGDFNREPASLNSAMNSLGISTHVRTVSQGMSTQISGGNLDYAVVGIDRNVPAILATSMFAAMHYAVQLVGQLASDHRPVAFKPLR
ncbi:MAG: cytolethal distending toxin subunit B family protein [Rhodanobacteraceae bacterium]|nr:cytolethal distending toxin subunit B family protein [Rhodanobacteraceae bacterium]